MNEPDPPSSRFSTMPPPRVGDTLPPPAVEAYRGRGRRVIAIGGGRGGVGKTLLAVNLGVYFAQLGREVVVCDADPFGSNLHAVLGLDAPPVIRPGDLEDGLAPPVATSVPGLRLLPMAYDPMTATPQRRTRGARWLAQVGKLPVDYVIINLGASTTASSLDVLLQADVGICVTTPEPLAVETTYGVCRALFARSVRRALMKERFKTRIVERAMATLSPLATPPEIVAGIARFDDIVAKLIAQQMVRVRPHLVVGQTRLRADLELGPAMAAVSERYLGITLDYLGHIEHDDAVWLTVRRRQPVLIDSPTSKSARNIERVARRILALLASREARLAEVHEAARHIEGRGQPPRTLYEVLGLSRSAADDEIRRAYKRQREIYKEGSLPIVSVVTHDVLKVEEARIEEAYDTLLDPVRRRAYDLSAFPDDAPVSIAPAREADEARMAELAMMQGELAREITPETEFTGELLRRVRESQGVELLEIAQTTKISTVHLQAIEDESAGDLPALVYVQGFVQQYAKFLKLDPSQVSKTYCRRLRGAASAQKPGRGGG